MSSRDELDQFLLWACSPVAVPLSPRPVGEGLGARAPSLQPSPPMGARGPEGLVSPRALAAARIPDAAWPEVFARAASHKVSNLVLERWWRVTHDLPGDTRAVRRGAAVQNLAFEARLLELLALLETHRIEALPFKGPLLAETVFGGLCNRNFGDLDILVPGDDLPRACRLLVDLGYRPLGGVSLEDYLRITLRGGHHVGLQHERHGTYVELHWEMAGRYLPVALDFATVRPFLDRVDYRGREVWNLGPELGLLYLCVHGAREYWRILDHVVCVAWHLERRPPDWDALLDLAQRWGGEKILLTGLGLAATLFDLVLPDRIAVLIHGSPGVRRLIARQSQRIFEDDRLAMLRLRTLPEFLRMHWTQLGDPVHFARWMALRLTTTAVEDLEPEDARSDSVGRQMALAPVQALRRLLRGRG